MLVIMNADGSAGVDVDARIGATVPALTGLAGVCWAPAFLLTVIGVLLMVLSLRRRPSGPAGAPYGGASSRPPGRRGVADLGPAGLSRGGRPPARRRAAAPADPPATGPARGRARWPASRVQAAPSTDRHRSGHDDDVLRARPGPHPPRACWPRPRSSCAVERRALGTAARDLAEALTGIAFDAPCCPSRQKAILEFSAGVLRLAQGIATRTGEVTLHRACRAVDRRDAGVRERHQRRSRRPGRCVDRPRRAVPGDRRGDADHTTEELLACERRLPDHRRPRVVRRPVVRRRLLAPGATAAGPQRVTTGATDPAAGRGPLARPARRRPRLVPERRRRTRRHPRRSSRWPGRRARRRRPAATPSSPRCRPIARARPARPRRSGRPAGRSSSPDRSPRTIRSCTSWSAICGRSTRANTSRDDSGSRSRVSPTPYDDWTTRRRTPWRRIAATTAAVPRDRTSRGVPVLPRSRTRTALSAMPRATTTASCPSTARSTSASTVASPSTGRTPSRPANAALARRANAVTSCPSATSASTAARPDPPVAPMTRILMTCSFARRAGRSGAGSSIGGMIGTVKRRTVRIP